MRTVIVAAALATALGACGGEAHLTATHGESYRAAFRQQSACEPGKSAEAVAGLDSQEAAIVSDGYRRSLAPKGAQPQDEDALLYVAPPTQGARRAVLPPPSVPAKER